MQNTNIVTEMQLNKTKSYVQDFNSFFYFKKKKHEWDSNSVFAQSA